MGLTFPQPCKWVTKTMEGEATECASVPATLPHFDWQCDPRNETCADGQYGEPIIAEYREYIPPPTEAPEPEIIEKETNGNSTDYEGSGSGDDEATEEEKALKSVEMITELLKKEQEVIKAAEHMKRDYEKLLHDQKVESILYDQLGWKPPPTKKPDAHIVAQWNPDSIYGKGPNSTIVGGDDVFKTLEQTSTTTSTTTTTTTTVETIDIDYEALVEPTTAAVTDVPTTMAQTVITTAEPTTVITVTIVEDDDIQDHDDRFDFDESLFADAPKIEMANDFVAPEYEYDEEEEEIMSNDFVTEMDNDTVDRSPKVKNPPKNAKIIRNTVDENTQIDLVAMMAGQNDKAVTINIFNNQVYNQNASGTARLVNNHGQDLTFGDKIGHDGPIPPGANMGGTQFGARGQMRSMQHMVEQLLENGRTGQDKDDVMRQLEDGQEFYQEQ